MKVFRKMQSELGNIKLQILALFSSVKPQVENGVSYVGQFASPEFAEKILREGVDKTTDPEWENTGAKLSEEYAKWVLIICGMACTSMALKHFKDKNVGTITLAKDALKHDVYRQEGDDISGMQYREYAKWVRGYGLDARVYSRLTMRGIEYLLSRGRLVIVSVNPNIREYETVSTTQKGGHLVLVTGYNKKNKTVTIHNPSGFTSSNTQQNHTISVLKFFQFYAGRGIAINSLNNNFES